MKKNQTWTYDLILSLAASNPDSVLEIERELERRFQPKAVDALVAGVDQIGKHKAVLPRWQAEDVTLEQVLQCGAERLLWKFIEQGGLPELDIGEIDAVAVTVPDDIYLEVPA